MDRFIVRQPRNDADFPSGHQMMSFQQNTLASMIPEAVYYEGGRYGGKFPGMQLGGNANGAGFMSIVHATPYPQAGMNVAQLGHNHHGQQIVSGIDHTYLAAYGNNAAYMANGEQSTLDSRHPTTTGFGGGYQNRNFTGADRNKAVTFSPYVTNDSTPQENKPPNSRPTPRFERSNSMNSDSFKSIGSSEVIKPYPPQRPSVATPKMDVEPLVKNVEVSQTKTRAEKIKALHKGGVRTFSGPVEKVLKWHKALQDIGVLVIYELVAKCVNVTPGQDSAKNLVIRDDNGPAMQVVYYEIDFLLPELKTPCTVRVIGRMMPGTCRLQAFNVRPATGDDVATLPRRAAVAAHHVAKLCKEFTCQLP